MTDDSTKAAPNVIRVLAWGDMYRADDPAIVRALAIAAIVDEKCEEELYRLASYVGPHWDNTIRRNIYLHGKAICNAIEYIAEARLRRGKK